MGPKSCGGSDRELASQPQAQLAQRWWTCHMCFRSPLACLRSRAVIFQSIIAEDLVRPVVLRNHACVDAASSCQLEPLSWLLSPGGGWKPARAATAAQVLPPSATAPHAAPTWARFHQPLPQGIRCCVDPHATCGERRARLAEGLRGPLLAWGGRSCLPESPCNSSFLETIRNVCV